MIINFHKNFKKAYKRLSLKLKQRVDIVIGDFRNNPHDILLKNHALKGELDGKRAISVTGDIRIIFEEFDSYVVVIMLDIGTHNQVYR